MSDWGKRVSHYRAEGDILQNHQPSPRLWLVTYNLYNSFYRRSSALSAIQSSRSSHSSCKIPSYFLFGISRYSLGVSLVPSFPLGDIVPQLRDSVVANNLFLSSKFIFTLLIYPRPSVVYSFPYLPAGFTLVLP